MSDMFYVKRYACKPRAYKRQDTESVENLVFRETIVGEVDHAFRAESREIISQQDMNE
jgi:hypothetical protein